MPENSSDNALSQDLADGRLLEWAEIYALDALPREDRLAVDAAVERADPAQRAEFLKRVWSTREALAAGYRAEDIPPADLFERITARLPRQDQHRDTGSPDTPRRPAAAEPPAPAAVDELAARRSRRSPLGSAGRWILAGAAAAGLVVGGIGIASTLGQDSVQEEVLQASDLRQRVIDLPTGGTAEVAVSAGEDAAVVTLSGVPAPPEGSVYQMWRIPADGSAPVSVGTMTGEDVSGSKATELTGIDPYSAVAVTVEPDGGSAAPTLPIVLEIPFSA